MHLRVAGDALLCMFKQSAPNAEARLQGALLFGSIFEALAVGRMMCQQQLAENLSCQLLIRACKPSFEGCPMITAELIEFFLRNALHLGPEDTFV